MDPKDALDTGAQITAKGIAILVFIFMGVIGAAYLLVGFRGMLAVLGILFFLTVVTLVESHGYSKHKKKLEEELKTKPARRSKEMKEVIAREEEAKDRIYRS